MDTRYKSEQVNSQTVSELSSAGHEARKTLYRKRRIKITIISAAICLLVVLSAIFALYTTTDMFKSKDGGGINIPQEDDGITRLQMVDTRAFNAVTNGDYSAFNGIDVSGLTSIQPFLIGYHVKIKDENIAVIKNGVLYGLKPGTTTGTVYTQDGKMVTTFPIEIRDKNNRLYYNVTFESTAGNIVYPVISGRSLADMDISIPALPSKIGYVPLNWTYNGEKFFSSNIINKDTTIVVDWQAVPVTLTKIPSLAGDYQQVFSKDLSSYAGGGSESYSFYTEDTLPSGMVLSNDGMLSGKPSEVLIQGSAVKAFSFDVIVKDKINATTATVNVQFTVHPRIVDVSFIGYTNLTYNGQQQQINAIITNLDNQDAGKVSAVLTYGGREVKNVNSYTALLDSLRGERAYCYKIEGEHKQVFSIREYQAEIKFLSGNINDQDFNFVYTAKPQTISAKVINLFDGDDCEVELAYNKSDNDRINVGENLIAEAISLSNPNYRIKDTQTAQSFNIIPAALHITVDSAEKIYGTPDPIFSMSVEGAKVNANGHSEASSLISILSHQYKRAIGENVGSYLLSVAPEFSADEKLANYNISVTPSTLNIVQREVSLMVNDAITKQYDGTPIVITSGLMFESKNMETNTGHVPGDDLYYTGQYIGSDGMPYVNASNDYLAISFTLTGTKANNYKLVGEYKGTINKYIINNIDGATVNNKVYDGSTIATVVLNNIDVPAGSIELSGITARFDSANVGVRNVTISGIDLDSYFSQNYLISSDALNNLSLSLTARILPRPVYISSDTVFSKVYDGDTTIINNTYKFATADEISGVVDGISLAYSGQYVSKNAGQDITLQLALTAESNPHNNYQLKGSYKGEILKRKVYIVGDIVKTYDATSSVDNSLLSFRTADTLTGVVSGDDLSFSGSYADIFAGTAKNVEMILKGRAKDNYQLTFDGMGKGIINKAQLTITVHEGLNKVYDGNIYTVPVATLNANNGMTVIGLQGTDIITSGTFATQDGRVNRGAGNTVVSKAMLLTAFQINNTSEFVNSYQITCNASVIIEPRDISVSYRIVDKVYDGLVFDIKDNFSIIGRQGEDDIYIDNISIIDMKNVGIYNQSASVKIKGSDIANYNLSTDTDIYVDVRAEILPRPVYISSDTVFSKVYDGDATITNNTYTFATADEISGVVDGISLAYSGQYINKNAGQDITLQLALTAESNPHNNYQLKGSYKGEILKRKVYIVGDIVKTYDATSSVDNSLLSFRTADTLTGVVSGDDLSFSGSYADIFAGTAKNVEMILKGRAKDNYQLTFDGMGKGIINKAQLTITVHEGLNKVYDASAYSISISALKDTAGITINGLQGSDAITSGTFATSDAVVNRINDSVLAKDMALTAFLINGSQDYVSNYNYSYTARATIYPAPITVKYNGIDKEYDGRVLNIFDDLSIKGKKGSDNLYIDAIDMEDIKNAGDYNIDVLVTFGGSDMGNYDISGAKNIVVNTKILEKEVTITTMVENAFNKKYDGDTNVFTSGRLKLAGIIAGDSVNFAGVYDSKNAGDRQIAFTLNGIDKDNYTLINPTTDARINKRELPITGEISKTYDGNTVFDGIDGLSLDAIAGDDITITTATFADKNKGVKNVTFVLGGIDSANYMPLSASGEILQRQLTIDVGASRTKTYDRTNIEVELNTLSLNLATGDAISGSRITADYRVGQPIFVANRTLAITDSSGMDMNNNYDIEIVDRTAEITKRDIVIILVANNKTFDNSINNSGFGFLYDGNVMGDDLWVEHGDIVFDDINAGDNKLVTASGLLLSGNDADNYNLINNTATDTASIYKREIVSVYGIAASDKTYDGTKSATVDSQNARFISSGVSVTDMYPNDLAIELTGEFIDINSGSHRVRILSHNLVGNDWINHYLAPSVEYRYNSLTEVRADINKRKLYIDLDNSQLNKIYDGSYNIIANNFIFAETTGDTGVITGDTVKVSATSYYSHGPNVKYLGDNQTIAGSQIIINLENNSNANYYMAVQEELIGKIERASVYVVTISGDDDYDKIYDASTSVLTADRLMLDGIITNDMTKVGFSGHYSTKNVGSGIDIAFSLHNIDSNTISNYILENPEALGNIYHYELIISDIYSSLQTPISMVYSGNNKYEGAFVEDTHFTIGSTVDNELITYTVVSKTFDAVYVPTASKMTAVFRLNADNDINKNYLLINDIGDKGDTVSVAFEGEITQKINKTTVIITSKGTEYGFNSSNIAEISQTDSFRLDFNFGTAPSGIFPRGEVLVCLLTAERQNDSDDAVMYGATEMYYNRANAISPTLSNYQIGEGENRVYVIISNPDNPIAYQEPSGSGDLAYAYASIKLEFSTSFIAVG